MNSIVVDTTRSQGGSPGPQPQQLGRRRQSHRTSSGTVKKVKRSENAKSRERNGDARRARGEERGDGDERGGRGRGREGGEGEGREGEGTGGAEGGDSAQPRLWQGLSAEPAEQCAAQ